MSINTPVALFTQTGTGSTTEIKIGYETGVTFRGVLTGGSATYTIEAKLSKFGDFVGFSTDTTGLTATSDIFTTEGKISAMRLTITSGTGSVYLDVTTGN